MGFCIKKEARFQEMAEKTGKAHMLLPGPDLKLLEDLTQALVPVGSKGLEIGTFIGKTTASLVELGYPMVTIENNPDYAQVARDLFQELQIQDRIQLLEGKALDILQQQHQEFWKPIKFVFVDSNKGGYFQYFKFLTSKCCSFRGYVFFDNVFLNGQIKDQIQNLFPESRRNDLGLWNEFGLQLPKKVDFNELGFLTKKKGPTWSASVQDQMIRMGQEARDSYQAILLNTSDGLLLLKKKYNCSF
jgi:predicted O-methyltransferase YrrM